MDSEALSRLFTELAETRRHVNVVIEGLREDVRQVADGVETLTSRLEQFGSRLEEESLETRRALPLPRRP